MQHLVPDVSAETDWLTLKSTVATGVNKILEDLLTK